MSMVTRTGSLETTGSTSDSQEAADQLRAILIGSLAAVVGGVSQQSSTQVEGEDRRGGGGRGGACPLKLRPLLAQYQAGGRSSISLTGEADWLALVHLLIWTKPQGNATRRIFGGQRDC